MWLLWIFRRFILLESCLDVCTCNTLPTPALGTGLSCMFFLFSPLSHPRPSVQRLHNLLCLLRCRGTSSRVCEPGQGQTAAQVSGINHTLSLQKVSSRHYAPTYSLFKSPLLLPSRRLPVSTEQHFSLTRDPDNCPNGI